VRRAGAPHFVIKVILVVVLVELEVVVVVVHLVVERLAREPVDGLRDDLPRREHDARARRALVTLPCP
jgi:hypothetical protein